LRIYLIVALKAVDKILMIRGRLKLIELEKKLLVLDMQQGNECFIPKNLS
jgi:hypothetical protein